MVAVPYSFSSGGTVTAAELNANFDALEAGIANISNANLTTNAGITADKLADRYTLWQEVIEIVPITAGTDLGSITQFTCPATATTLYRQRMTLNAGQEAYLCEVEFYVHLVTAGSNPSYPTLSVLVDGTVLGGGAVTVNSSATYWRLRNASPITNPLATLTDTQVISVSFDQTTTAGTEPTIAGVWLRLVYKVRLTA